MGKTLVLDCDCILRPNNDADKTWTLTQCPLHAAAPKLLEACKATDRALLELCGHSAFGDGAPEFNVGGYGYELALTVRIAIAEAEPK